MNLSEKVLKLKREGVIAVRHALSWERMIREHGEEKTTEFYKSLGLNHLETKSYEWEGLKLSREPKEHEKLCIKGIAQAQESSKAQIGAILLNLRSRLISDGLKGINDLDPATYHTLVLNTPAEFRTSLRDRLIETHRYGRLLVAAELGRGKSLPALWGEPSSVKLAGRARAGSAFKIADEDEDEFDDLDMLTDVTDSRISNDVQSRITAAAARFALLGLVGVALLGAIQKELEAGSVSYIDRASQGLANKVISIGRGDEAQRRSDEWERVEYSAILDQNVCGPCAAEDGKEAATEDELTPVPNPECEGGDWCRCFHVFITEGNV